jgi:hypothetical protein
MTIGDGSRRAMMVSEGILPNCGGRRSETVGSRRISAGLSTQVVELS